MIIEDGNLMFCRAAYDVERTAGALERSGVEPAATAALVQLLRTGRPSLYLNTPGVRVPQYEFDARMDAPQPMPS
jgi:hypothetical protein